MKRRIFIAILLPQKIKEGLIKSSKTLRDLNVRWLAPENLHLTLLFIGWIEEERLFEIKRLLKEIASKHPPFLVRFSRITLGPSKKYPRMIWAVGERNEILENLHKDLKNIFSSNKIPFDAHYPLKIHLTLARAKNKELFEKKIDRNIDISLLVNEISLMESQLKASGAEYKLIEDFQLLKT